MFWLSREYIDAKSRERWSLIRYFSMLIVFITKPFDVLDEGSGGLSDFVAFADIVQAAGTSSSLSLPRCIDFDSPKDL